MMSADGRATLIRTPDQRVRVFVSSTLQELAEERAAVRRAIEGLHLSPVMFELGARAHPPASLYRAYLDQSHVFLGIYGQRYGWVAPGMDVSGLEDEYRLAGDKPKLVYIKSSESRDDLLAALLDQVRANDDVSYKSFTDSEELGRLVADDLAYLLSERFMAEPPASGQRQARFALPTEVSSFVGRTTELAELCGLLQDDDVRLVTVTGPGGIGKTRLALRAAAQAASFFEDGAVFVDLASVKDARLVPEAIAAAVGVGNGSGGSSVDALCNELADRSLLLVADNFERLLPATDVFNALLRAAPRMKLLVTSRQVLRVRAEHEFSVPPLTPSEAIGLFSARAGAVSHGFAVNDENAEAIERICRRLEGVPLAIELAAARSRLYSPNALLEQLEHRLDALVDGARDLPERQRTLRDTLLWSYDLLDDDERSVFASLGAFVGTFSLAAAEYVCADMTSRSVLDVVASLADQSLLRVEAAVDEPRFRMLDMISEFARERLADSSHADHISDRHASFFQSLSAEVAAGIRGPQQVRWLQRLVHQGDGDNLRAAMSWLLHQRRLDELADVAWALWVPAWIGGRLEEARLIAHATLAADGDLSDRSRGRLLAGAGWFGVWQGDRLEGEHLLRDALETGRSSGDDEAIALAMLGLSLIADPDDHESAEHLALESAHLSHVDGDRWGEVAALTMLAVIYVRNGHLEGNRALFENALSGATSISDGHLAVIAEVNMATYLLARGELDEAAKLLASSVRRQRSIRLAYSMLFLLHGAALLARARGSDELASQLLGAASRQRRMIGTIGSGNEPGRTRLINALQSSLTPQVFDDMFDKGANLTDADALEAAARATETRGSSKPTPQHTPSRSEPTLPANRGRLHLRTRVGKRDLRMGAAAHDNGAHRTYDP